VHISTNKLGKACTFVYASTNQLGKLCTFVHASPSELGKLCTFVHAFTNELGKVCTFVHAFTDENRLIYINKCPGLIHLFMINDYSIHSNITVDFSQRLRKDNNKHGTLVPILKEERLPVHKNRRKFKAVYLRIISLK